MRNSYPQRWVWFWIGSWFAFCSLGLVACRKQSEPEKAWLQFQEALKTGKAMKAWSLLSTSTQRQFALAAQAQGAKLTGSVLFQESQISRNSRLRLVKAPNIQNNRATLSLRNELEQPVTLQMHKEKGSWRVHLGLHFRRNDWPLPRAEKTPNIPSPSPSSKPVQPPKSRSTATSQTTTRP